MTRSSDREIRIKGSPVSEGLAIGQPYFWQLIEEEVPDFAISSIEVDAEVARYRKALFSSKEDLTKIRKDLEMEGSDEAITAIETHIQMLEDPMITTDIEGKIRQQLRNTESVFHSVINEYENRFSERNNSFFHERLVDVKDVSKRILGHLREKQDAQLHDIPLESIVFASEINPSISAGAHPSQVLAFVTQDGGGNSHAALIARSKGIPYVAGVEIDKVKESPSEKVIVDGFEGLVILNPTEETLAHYKNELKKLQSRFLAFKKQDHLSCETIDGHEVQLLVNVGNPDDLDSYPYRHDGVGLFRTEYLFLQEKEFFPSEQYQEKAYRSLLEKMEQKPVVIRVFDLGGDKTPSLFFGRRQEPNPALGNRGIRFLLRDQELFKSQLRAIFRASAHHNVRILLPLISDIGELHLAKKIIEEVKLSLQKENELVPDLLIGCMIEVPSAVMICKEIAETCDFLSVGTNDLVQYTLGVDRSNPAMSGLYYPAHPSIIRMIKMIAVESGKQKISLSICGEIASNTLFTPLLVGLGLSELSITPRYLPYVKQTIRAWSKKEAEELAQKVLGMGDPQEISKLLKSVQKK